MRERAFCCAHLQARTYLLPRLQQISYERHRGRLLELHVGRSMRRKLVLGLRHFKQTDYETNIHEVWRGVLATVQQDPGDKRGE